MTKTVAFIRSSGFFSDSRSTKEIRTLVGAGYKVIAIGWDRKGIAKEKCNAVFADISDSVSFKLMDLLYNTFLIYLYINNILTLLQ